MRNKLGAIIIFLMLAFSLSLITGCQKTNEKTIEVKEKVTETNVEIKEEAVKTVAKVRGIPAATAEEINKQAVEAAEDIKEEAARTVAKVRGIPAATAEEIRKQAVEAAEDIKEEATETVKEATGAEAKEQEVKTSEDIKEEAVKTVARVTGIPAATAEEIKEQALEASKEAEEMLNEPEPPIETKTFSAPTLIVQPDDMRTTLSVTLRWNPVRSPYGNSVTYFVRLYSGDGFITPSGWISFTNWTITINRPCNYTWQVKARDNVYLQESEWSTADSFIVNTHCSAKDG